MARSHPEHTWECSHIGGDRFAGNLVILPEGLYYGRVDAVSGPRIAAAHESGQLDLEHLRGRVTSRFAIQAAEWHLRSKLDLSGIDDVRPVRSVERPDGVEAVFELANGMTWRVRLRIGRTEPERLTCASSQLSLAPAYQLLDIAPADTPATIREL
jgi:(2Fe-2S) ferredoxin